jgi:hypothetical protein
MPSLEEFIESLTQEQTKLINMGKIKGLLNLHAAARAILLEDG